MAVVSIEQARQIVRLLKEGNSTASVAKKFGTSRGQIRTIQGMSVDPEKLITYVENLTGKRNILGEMQDKNKNLPTIAPVILPELEHVQFNDRKSFSLACQLFTPEAVSGLVVLARDKYTKPADKIKVWEYILDQGWGKAPAILEDPEGEEEDGLTALKRVIKESIGQVMSEGKEA